ncbi:MAG: RecX family transcriptional regulator [Bacilli bacterium]|nr:RecX family transcriptional regulator [Bacilli bacterium]
MLITKVLVTKNQAIVQFSNNQELEVSINTYLDLHLREGLDIELKEIKAKEDYYKALEYGLKLTRKREYSSFKVKLMINKKYSEIVTNQVIKRLEQLSLIDDEYIINKTINKCLTRNYGKLKIIHQLEMDGFKDVDKYFTLEVEEQINENINQAAYKYIKSHKRYNNDKMRQNLYRYLLYLGYNNEEINHYMSLFGGENNGY